MGIVIDKIRKAIYCRKHKKQRFMFSTRKLAQILADGVFPSPYRDSHVVFCKGCCKYYVARRWNKLGERMRKEVKI